jgi:hypothetical protein
MLTNRILFCALLICDKLRRCQRNKKKISKNPVVFFVYSFVFSDRSKIVFRKLKKKSMFCFRFLSCRFCFSDSNRKVGGKKFPTWIEFLPFFSFVVQCLFFMCSALREETECTFIRHENNIRYTRVTRQNLPSKKKN